MMTVGELMELLETCNPGAEVRLATQPSWPFEYSIGGVTDTVDSEDPDTEDFPEDVVWIAEGSQLGYLPMIARDQLGW